MCFILHAAQAGRTAVGVNPSSVQLTQQRRQFTSVQLQLCSMLQYMQQLPGLNTSNSSAPAALGNCGCVLASYNMSGAAGVDNASAGNCSSTVSGWSSNSTPAVLQSNPKSTTAKSEAREQMYEATFLVLLVLVVVQCYALREFVEAVALWKAICVYAGTTSAEALDAAGCTVHTWFQHPCSKARLMFACTVPWLQVTTAVLAFCSAAILITLPTSYMDKVQLVLNGVAIVFVLEVDDKVGDALSMTTHQSRIPASVPLVTLGGDAASLTKNAWLARATVFVKWAPYFLLCVLQGYFLGRMVYAVGTALAAEISDKLAAGLVFGWFITMAIVATALIYKCYLCFDGASDGASDDSTAVMAANSGVPGSAGAADAANQA
jgi:hypothetical protein